MVTRQPTTLAFVGVIFAVLLAVLGPVNAQSTLSNSDSLERGAALSALWKGSAKGITLNPADWTFDGYNGAYTVAVFFRLSRQRRHGVENPQIWVREEFSDTDKFGYFSSEALWEVDCANGKWRRLQSSFYTYNNLAGPVTHRQLEPRGWDGAPLGTYEEGVWLKACSEK